MKEIMDKMMSSAPEADHDSAKMEVLEELRELAMKLMGNKMGDKMAPEMSQVTVAAPDEKGLKEGLEVAKEAVPAMDEMESADDDMELEEIEAMIRELEDKRRAKQMQS